MLKAVRHQLVQNTLPGVTEGGVAQVVAEGHGFGQVLVEPQGTGDGSGDAHDLQGVGHSGTVVVASGLEEDLSLVLQAAKGLGVDNAVHVPLEAGADVAGGDVSLPAAALGGKGGVGCKKCRLPLFGLFRMVISFLSSADFSCFLSYTLPKRKNPSFLTKTFRKIFPASSIPLQMEP